MSSTGRLDLRVPGHADLERLFGLYSDPQVWEVERTGLSRVWRGPDAGNPDVTAIRLLYTDQPLSPGILRTLTEQ